MIIGKDATAARQGDIYLERVGALPAGLTTAGRDALGCVVPARGERRGHAHAIRDRRVCGFLTVGAVDVEFIEVGGSGATLNHELPSGEKAEHEPLSLTPGIYRVVRQREYVAPRIERQVAD
ncbi:MAG TPA: hypothetical protein VFC47_15565 [Caulobacteraceae bacterium]|nr:hypothetical protein [Caulobacteraceae bacterium]